jgi:hypothetical protein
MFIAIFSVFILETINPSLTQFKSITPQKKENLPCCEYSKSGSNEKIYEFMKEEECLKKSPAGKIVDNIKCIDNPD